MPTHRTLVSLVLVSLITAAVAAQELTVPNKPTGTLKFAVIGDSGTGDNNQYRLAKVFTEMHQRFAYEFVLMMGDNMYGSENARDFQRKFEIPYKSVLDKGVKFYASLGNHDSTNSACTSSLIWGATLLHLQAKAGHPLFRARQQLHGSHAAAVAGEELSASGSDWKSVSIIRSLVGRPPRLRYRSADQPSPVPQYGVDVVMAVTSTSMRAAEATKGHPLFHFGGAGNCERRRRRDVHRKILRPGLSLHDFESTGIRALPGDHVRRRQSIRVSLPGGA